MTLILKTHQSKILEKLINETKILLKVAATAKNITITSAYDNELMINCDKNMITTVLRNLITNAIKFTPKDGNIEVSAMKVYDESGSFIKVKVKDSGVGIDADMIKKLFRVGEMSTSIGTEGEKGTGLGLILCKEFVEKHGGIISVESQKNMGSIFSFTLPVTEEKSLFNQINISYENTPTTYPGDISFRNYFFNDFVGC